MCVWITGQKHNSVQVPKTEHTLKIKMPTSYLYWHTSSDFPGASVPDTAD